MAADFIKRNYNNLLRVNHANSETIQLLADWLFQIYTKNHSFKDIAIAVNKELMPRT